MIKAKSTIDQKIERIIRNTLSEALKGVRIHKLTITPSEDEAGDEVLIVEVVFDSRNEVLPTRATTRLVRDVLPALEEAGEKRFPIFSFVAESELKKARSAAR